MKTKDKNGHVRQSTNSNVDERSPAKEEGVKNDQASKRQRSSEDDSEKALSSGYFPDGPGGNYRGV